MAGLYAIIDLPHPHKLPTDQRFAALCEGAGPQGLAMCQLRFKSATSAQRREALVGLGPACLTAGVPLLVNDDVELALAGLPGVVGVHLGQDDAGFDDVAGVRERADRAGLGRFLVGVSTHDVRQLRAAIAQRPDYIAYGPVLATASKANPDPVVGFDGLADACRITSTPVVAIGGLDPKAAHRAVAVGATMVAVIGGLVASTAAATTAAARAYVEAIRQAAQLLTAEQVNAQIPVMSVATLTEIASWADDLAVLAGLRLPTRFRPRVYGSSAYYRPSDVCDLLAAIGKREDESWAQWTTRGDHGDASVVLLRRTNRPT